ncbi:MAG: SDR family NAD(P)-dependent oxidoreductase [Planctomycetaceae bacterium]
MPLTKIETARASLARTNCLVTGGAGFIGSNLVDELVDAGATVRVLDNLSTGFRENLSDHASSAEVQFIHGDASDPAQVDEAIRGIDYVFHHAAMASVPRSMREPGLCHAWTATSTLQLLEAARQHGVRRFVLASTSAAYGNSPFVSKRESDPIDPLSPYAAAKLASEQYCRAFFRGFGLETVVLRYFNVFGPRQDPASEYSAVIPRFVSMILAGQRPIIYGDGHQSRDFVHVRDVVQANLLAATAAAAVGGTFNIGCGASTTLLQLLGTLSETLGRPIQAIHEPPRAGDVRDSMADITQARVALGYEPAISVAQGLRDSIAYYEQSSTTSVR